MTACYALESPDSVSWPTRVPHPMIGHCRQAAQDLGLVSAHIEPKTQAAIVVRGGILTQASWGWSRREDKITREVNAYAQRESLYVKPDFDRALQTGRCVVPMTAFFGRERFPNGRPGRRWAFRSVTTDVLWVAGLWTQIRTPAGPERCFLIITRPAESWDTIALRVPLTLDAAGVGAWLDMHTLRSDLVAAMGTAIDREIQGRPVDDLPHADRGRYPDCLASLGTAWELPAGPELLAT